MIRCFYHKAEIVNFLFSLHPKLPIIRIKKCDNSRGTAYLTDVVVARFALRVLSGCTLAPAGQFDGVEGITRQLVA
jgi:hypothetical protein